MSVAIPESPVFFSESSLEFARKHSGCYRNIKKKHAPWKVCIQLAGAWKGASWSDLDLPPGFQADLSQVCVSLRENT